MPDPVVSIVFPVFNEAENLQRLYAEVTRALDPTGLGIELVFVDNGSTDLSLVIMKRLRDRDPRVEFVSLSRNFGHQGALIAGLHHARGQAVITMDADLQHPPSLLPRMIELWQQGHEVVYTHKTGHAARGVRGLQVRLFYWLVSKWSGLKLSFGQSDFRLLDRKVVDILIGMTEARKFLRGLVEWSGFKQTGLSYEPGARAAGESKFPFRALASFALDGMLAFSFFPLRWSVAVGFVVASLSFLYGVVIVVMGLANLAGARTSLPPGWATLVASMMFLTSIQLIAIGILSEYVGRIFEQTKGRPEFIVRDASIGPKEVRLKADTTYAHDGT